MRREAEGISCGDESGTRDKIGQNLGHCKQRKGWQISLPPSDQSILICFGILNVFLYVSVFFNKFVNFL